MQVKGIHVYLYLALLFVAIETFFEVIIPLLMSQIIDQGILLKNSEVFIQKGIEMIVCAILSLFFGLLYAHYAAKFTSLFSSQMRQKEFHAIQKYAFENLDHFEISSLITRLTSDVTTIQNAWTASIRPFVRGPVMLVLGMIMAFIINKQLALVFVIILPFLAIILYCIVRKVAPMYPILQQAMDAINARIQENLVAIRVVKAFVREEYEEDKFKEVNEHLSSVSQNTFKIALLNVPSFQAAMYVTIVCLVYFGCQMIFDGKMQIGELTGLLSYVLQIMNSLVMISNVFLLMTRSMASISRIQEVFDEKVNLVSGTLKEEMEDGSIDFKDVSYKYDVDAKENVLSHINWHIESGQKVGILGSTGSAKSTLVSLIPRLYDVNEGTIYVGKKDVKDLDLYQLREEVVIVLQTPILFSSTIEENLRWGNEEASMEDIRWACRVSCADEFIEQLPDGYQTMLAQGGTNLSGGQKQRLCIARALLKHPKILILDDSCSAVDTNTNKKMIHEFSKLKDMTLITIAQRISSVSYCDQIMILEDGCIQEIGSHRQLMETSAYYKELYTSQNRGDSDEIE